MRFVVACMPDVFRFLTYTKFEDDLCQLQHRLKLNLGLSKQARTFSFDLLNGACGTANTETRVFPPKGKNDDGFVAHGQDHDRFGSTKCSRQCCTDTRSLSCYHANRIVEVLHIRPPASESIVYLSYDLNNTFSAHSMIRQSIFLIGLVVFMHGIDTFCIFFLYRKKIEFPQASRKM